MRFAFLLLALSSLALAQADRPVPAEPEVLRTFPFSMTGKLVFEQGGDWFQGSGAVIRPNAVLTAAHNLWNAERGFSTDVIFRRAVSGEQAASEQLASRVYVLGGYRDQARRFSETDPRSFAQDLGGVVFPQPVAQGSSAGWWANPAIFGRATETLALGYGAEFHSGSELLAVGTNAGFQPVTDAFYASRAIYLEGGMSGGPVFVRDEQGRPLITGVVVAGAEDLHGGGIRVLDATAAAFIRAYLK